MDSNAYCACGNAPSKYCLCLKPTKTFLCDHCIGEHVCKFGAHNVFPIDTEDIHDVDLLNSRRKAAEEVLVQVERMMQRISIEWESVPTVVQSLYQQHCLEVWGCYEKAQTEIRTLYQEMWDVMEKTKNELKGLDKTMKVKLSRETLEVFKLNWHCENEVLVFLDVPMTAQKIMRGENVNTPIDVRRKWACSSSECGVCWQKLTELCMNECCEYSSTPKPPPLCRLCQDKADEAGLCKACAARTGQKPKKETVCLVCFSQGCTVHH